jgi:hypothetical protein
VMAKGQISLDTDILDKGKENTVTVTVTEG